MKSELDEICERISMRPEEPCEHKRTLTFETYADGSVLVTCAEHPLLALICETRGRAFETGWLLADEMEKLAVAQPSAPPAEPGGRRGR